MKSLSNPVGGGTLACSSVRSGFSSGITYTFRNVVLVVYQTVFWYVPGSCRKSEATGVPRPSETAPS